MPMGEEDNSKKREGEKEERMGLLSGEQAPGPASPLQTHSRKEKKKGRQDGVLSSQERMTSSPYYSYSEESGETNLPEN